jgi:hypothetical protein
VNVDLTKEIAACIEKFIEWLHAYGEVSYDHQTFFAGPWGRKAKELYYSNPILGTLAVSPIIFCEAFFPSARRFFWKKQRFPIADAHYAMGFALLDGLTPGKGYYKKSVHFLEELEKSRSPGFKEYCWGYPFDWITKNGTIPANTPFITTLPYVYEAFHYTYLIDHDERWLNVMHSIAEHALRDIRDFETSKSTFSCGYGPYDDKGGVVNASAYRAFLLTSAHSQFSDDRYMKAAKGNINFVIRAQRPNGSWPYAIGDDRDFVDHFHTCFVLKALAKIEQLTGSEDCLAAITNGVRYYLENLLDENCLPKPFSKAPRLTVYRRELYDYAECINLCVLLKDPFPELEQVIHNVLHDLLKRWRKTDGSFCSRELFLGWDKVPMHRWAQSQVFRSLCLFLVKRAERESH